MIYSNNHLPVIGLEAPKPITLRSGRPVRAVGIDISILLVNNKALYPQLVVIYL
jgi:hypothetical protein